MTLYRDAFLGLRARLLELAARIHDREALVTEAFWSALPIAQQARLAELRKALEAPTADSFEEIARAEGMLANYLGELEGLLDALPALERAFTEVPDEVTVTPIAHSQASWRTDLLDDHIADELTVAFEAMVREHDRTATFAVDGKLSQLARFRDHGLPLALRAVVLSSQNEQVGEVGMTLFTSIPRALPPLVLRHETLVLSVSKALGIKDDVEVGDPSFDGLFLIEGTQDAADLFLTPQVRTHLLTLARFDVPTLTVDPPSRLASLQWRFEPAPKALDAAIKVLAAVRATPPFLRIRRG